MKNFEDTAANIVIAWADNIAFSDDLARLFFTATITEALYKAHARGRKAEARKRKASISARYVKRLTPHAPDGSWACAKCGYRNNAVHNKCHSCGKRRR